MSVARFKKDAKTYLQREAGPMAPLPDQSIALLDSHDPTYRNVHVVDDLLGMIKTLHSSLEYNEDKMLEEEHQRGENEHILEYNETMVLWQNASVTLDAYMKLGGDALLSHSEQAKLLEHVRKLPTILLQAAAHFKEVKEGCMDADPETADEMQRTESFCGTFSRVVARQLRLLDGHGRGKTGTSDDA